MFPNPLFVLSSAHDLQDAYEQIAQDKNTLTEK